MKVLTNSLKKFINLEASSSIILFAASIAAIIWANSSYGYLYEQLWNHQFTIGFTDTNFQLSKPLILWVNDGLMAIFFFLIGLEVKREILVGELTTLRKASLPILAAIGGMIFPVLIFVFLNKGKVGAEGWGIAMATDIAFTLGILKLLGNRVPLGLKIFLTAFAIVDDIGAVLVIALFYSSNIQWDLIFYAFVLIGFAGVLSYKQKYSKYTFFIIGVIAWILFLKSGVHPTIAGILMAFTIPIKRSVEASSSLKKIENQIHKIKKTEIDKSTKILSQNQLDVIDEVGDINEKAKSPLQHLEHSLHGWVSYLIMPVFALANAGVVISFGESSVSHVSFSITMALLVGNVLGISLLSFIGLKLKIADLPKGVNFKHLFAISLLGAVGFTMSLFIVNLAYTDTQIISAAKKGVIMGSLIAGVSGYFLLKLTLKKPA